MGGVNNPDLRKSGFFAYVISSQELSEGLRAIRRIDRRCETAAVWRTDGGRLMTRMPRRAHSCRVLTRRLRNFAPSWASRLDRDSYRATGDDRRDRLLPMGRRGTRSRRNGAPRLARLATTSRTRPRVGPRVTVGRPVRRERRHNASACRYRRAYGAVGPNGQAPSWILLLSFPSAQVSPGPAWPRNWRRR